MLNKLKIRTKILIMLTCVSVVAVGISGYISYTMARDSLEKESFNKLIAVREMKANQVEDYFQQIVDQIFTFSENRMIVDAMKAFKTGFQKVDTEPGLTDSELFDIASRVRNYYQYEYFEGLRPNLDMYEARREELISSQYLPKNKSTIVLQDLYIASNSYETGSKYLLDQADDGSSYSETHKIYHPVIRSYLEKFGYYDILLVDHETGHIVYSVSKEVDFGTSLLTGPYKDTNVADAFRAAKDASDKDFVTLVDFESYHPSYNAQASFIASPVYDGNEKVGVLVFQTPIDRINNIMTNRHEWSEGGLGVSGETYLVGDDFTFRNQSRFLIEDRENYLMRLEEIGVPKGTIEKIKRFNSTIALQKVKTEGTVAALRGGTGNHIFPGYRGVSVLSSYKPLDIPDVNWVIMSEVEEVEAFSYIYSLRKSMLFGFATVVVIVIAIANYFSRTITRPLSRLKESAVRLAEGNFYSEQIDTSDEGEIGELAKSLDVMQKSIKHLIDSTEKSTQHLEETVAERTLELNKSLEIQRQQHSQLEQQYEKLNETQEQLIQSQIRIRSIIELASDAIIVINSQSEVLLWNRGAEDMFGFSAEEMIGQPLFPIIPEKYRQVHQKKIEHSESAAEYKAVGLTREVNGLHKKGHEFPIELSITSWRVGGKTYYSSIIRDLTERKKMEAHLQNAYQTIKTQKERMESELNVGREIQSSMLPVAFPAFADYSEFVVYADLQPASEVCGDFYDFYFIDVDRLCFCIGDVSGKGVPSALFMAVTKTLIKSRSANDSSTASILTHVNDELSSDNKSCMFVTLFAGILNIKTGELVYTNAGHNPPYIKRSSGSIERLGQRHGPVIGAMSGMTFKEDKATLSKGDAVLLYTDGVTEAVDSDYNLFSEKRLAALLSSLKYGSVEDLVKATMSAVEQFEGEADQTDDIALLAIKFLGQPKEKPSQNLEVIVKNRLPEIEHFNQRFNVFANQCNIPRNMRLKMNMIFDELLNNIISYAYPDENEHEIDVKVELFGDRLTVTIADDGTPFNPVEAEAPEIDLPIEERHGGGIGIHLVREMVDKISYKRQIDKNVLSLVKHV